MTNEEKELFKMYLVNEGFRRDSELISARHAYLQTSRRSFNDVLCLRLLRAHVAKSVFDKICHDLCALLDI